MKVAITGSSGYLGQMVVRHFEDDPGVESILGLDIAEPSATFRKFTFVKADVLTADFSKIFSGYDVVLHMAFIVQPPKKMDMPTIDRINIEGSRRVFEGAFTAGVKKIIHLSSVSAYGAHPDNPLALDESSPLRPNENWYYSRAKGRVEAILDGLEKEHPETVVIRLRPTFFVGPNINNMVGDIILSPLLMCARPKLKFDFCWDADIVSAVGLALHYPRSDIFNLAGAGPVTMHDIGHLFDKRVFRIFPGLVIVFSWFLMVLGLISKGVREWLLISTWGGITVSSERARQLLKWNPRYTTAETLLRFRECQRKT